MSDKSKEIPKKQRGGPRPGAGRPKGARSASTLKREARVKAEVQEALAQIGTEEEIEEADPYSALTFALKAYWRSGNMQGLVSVAKEMLPYSRPRMASADAMVPLPEDLLPDPEPTPDEDVPPDVIDPQPRRAGGGSADQPAE